MHRFVIFILCASVLLVARDLKRHRDQSHFVSEHKNTFAKSAEYFEQWLVGTDVANMKRAQEIVAEIDYSVNTEHSTNGFIVFTPIVSLSKHKVVICITDTSDQNSFTCFILKDTQSSLKFMHNFHRVKSKLLNPKQKIDFVGGKIAHEMHAHIVGDPSVAGVHHVDGPQNPSIQQTMCYFNNCQKSSPMQNVLSE